MFSYTRNNHFSLGFGDQSALLPKLGSASLRVNFGRVERPRLSFRQEAAQAASDIRKSTAQPIFVCLSGGIDCEIVCRAFIDAGYKITPLIFRWKYGINQEDVATAIDFCRKFDLRWEEREVDVVEFFTNGFWHYSERLGLPVWAAVWKAWLADLHGGFLVMGSGLPQTFRDEAQGRVVIREDSHSLNPLALNARDGVPDFFRYHPELMAALLCDPDILRWCTVLNLPLEKLGEVLEIKFFALSKYYQDDRYPLAFRQKRTGVEKISELAMAAIRKSSEKFGHNVHTVNWGYMEFLNLLNAHPDAKGDRHVQEL